MSASDLLAFTQSHRLLTLSAPGSGIADDALLTDSGDHRSLCGLVIQAEHAGADGGFACYVLTLQDPFAVLSKRINSRVFQDLSVCEFVALLLASG